MVIEVMNELKGEFAFVDLLKPEAGAVAPILAALKPAALAKLRTIASAATRRKVDDLRMRFGWLGDAPGGSPPGTVDAARLPRLVGARLRREETDQMAGDLLDQAERRLAEEREEPIDLIDADLRQEYLGLWGAGLNLFKGKPVQALREALEGLDQDHSFTYTNADETYRKLDEMVSTDIDFLVAGHTHLARAIERGGTRACYYNTGTWARVFRLDKEVRRSPDAFDRLYQALKTPSIDALDKAPGLLPVRPHAAVIRREGRQVVGELHTVADKPPYATTLVEHTRFVRS
jgi:hypothetical protein